MVTIPILATKLYIPPPRTERVSRPQLVRRLDLLLAPGARLALLAAPAGFGKTTLLGEWIAAHSAATGRRGVCFCWLSLDERDDDPGRFLTYVLAAIQTVDPNLGATAAVLLEMPVSAEFANPLEAAWLALINDLAAISYTLVVVLDDCHRIAANEVQSALGFWLEHLPPQVRLVLSTRSDPPLALARLRARNQMVELRAADLRFDQGEADHFLRQVMGLELAPADVHSLEARTDGWIAGLQLAALSLRGRSDVAAFIADFTGSNRYVVDYLVEEVLRRQSPVVQRFLLCTSILERLNPALCDALTGGTDGVQMLETLEQANLYLEPLDEERNWYRYHHLFAEFLRSRLQRAAATGELAESVTALHRRACLWYESHGLAPDAIEHALHAQDYERAVRLIESEEQRVLMPGDTRLVMAWLRLLPEEIIRSRARLCLVRAWSLFTAGELDEARSWCQQARHLASDDEQQLHAEAGMIAALIAVLQGRLPEALQISRQALAVLTARNRPLYAMTYLVFGLAHEMSGDLPGAEKAYLEACASSDEVGNPLIALTALSQLLDLRLLQARLHEARACFDRAAGYFASPGKQFPVASVIYDRMGRLLYEWNDLEQAAFYLAAAVELGLQWESADIFTSASTYLAMVKHAQGDGQGTGELMRQAEQALRKRMVSPATVEVARLQLARLHLLRGNLAAAGRWARDCQQRSAAVMAALREMEGVMLARVALAQGDPAAALAVLTPCLETAETGGRVALVIELLTIQALAHRAAGAEAEALAALERALALAQPEGYVRMFVDEGPLLAELLYRLQGHATLADYVSRLLAICEGRSDERSRRGEVSLPVSACPVQLVEPLSERELQVLRLIAAGLSNQEIAGRLVVTVSTVKTHINNIYSKMGVQNRIQAVSCARALDWL